jgi:eukaryotic-like serine/threonine-protein kinase
MVARSNDDAPGTAVTTPLRGVGMPPTPKPGASINDMNTRLLGDATVVDRGGLRSPVDIAPLHGDAVRGFANDRNKRIGRFELIREIARGGMGQVFLGRDTQLGRKVAIKFLLYDDPMFLQRFLVEARATARCTHENIVTIYEVGEHEGLPYLVLEYLEGKTLNDLLETTTLTCRQFVDLIVPVVRALERAHEHKIVHRDLKPLNIFVTARGQVKVLDFGIARIVDQSEVYSGARASAILGAIDADTGSSEIGTLPYMSPEQLGTDDVDHRSDFWAVGIMFWRALVRVHPAGSTVADVLRDRVCDSAPLPSIGTVDPTIPRELVGIVDRCLCKHKADRYQTASELLADLQAFLAPTERLSGEQCPYRGLVAFGEQDAKLFFGRTNEIRTAVAQLESWPLLAVVGPSGVGKSSFVHAGIIPAVRATGGDWQVHVLRPGRVPLHRLATILEAATGEDGATLVSQLLQGPGVFGAMLRAAAARQRTRMLIVVDQLEELFTLCDSDDLRQMFLAALFAAADDPGSPLRVVLSMRADFLDRLAVRRGFVSELSRGLFFLTAPDQDNLREVLERPAELAGYSFEDPTIIEDMLQVATSRGALPLLSFAASRLWDARDRQRRVLTLASYRAMGGVAGAFARHADQVTSGVSRQNQMLLRAIMTRLVTPEGTRAVVDQRELLSLSRDPQEVQRVLDQLVRARLIQLATDFDGGTTVEIVHEMLITEWPTLARWLEDSHAMRGFMHELRQAVKQWEGRGRPDDLLWRGATAQEAVGHAARGVLVLSVAEQDFITATRRQLARNRRRKVLAAVAILSALGLVLAGAGVAVVRIKAAESEAQDKARKESEARAQVQSKVEALEAAEQRRDTAEREAAEQARQKNLINADFEESKERSREQLEAKNKELRRQLAETEAAKQRAEAATVAEQTAKLALQKLLKQKEKELRDARDQKGIITDIPIPPRGRR